MKRCYISFVLLFCMIGTLLTGCSSEKTGDSEVMGRITAISEQEITMTVFGKPENGERPESVSGGAIRGRGGAASDGAIRGGQRPEGTPPADMQMGEAPEDGKGQRPEGTPPTDMKKNMQDETSPAGGRQGSESAGQMGESRTITITKDTKVYQQNGEEKTEVSAADLQLGTMATVVLSGDEAVSITIQTGMGGNRGDEQ